MQRRSNRRTPYRTPRRAPYSPVMDGSETPPAEEAETGALLEAVYDELRRLAGAYLARERSDHTLQPTALVHEAYAKLASQETPWANRAHFMGIAAQAMRRILVDHARGKHRAKRGGGWQRVELDVALAEDPSQTLDLLALDEALSELAILSPREAQVVELRYFGGLDVVEVAEVLDVSSRTVKRAWRFARAWLGARMTENEPDA